MTGSSYKRTVLALAALELFPKLIRESLISDSDFREFYELVAESQISIGKEGVMVAGSKLYDCIREILEDRTARPTLRDEAGNEWLLEFIEIDSEQCVGMSHGEHRFLLPYFSSLSPDQAERLKVFDRNADDVNLSNQSVNEWREILASRPLSNDEIDALRKQLEETPTRIAYLISSDLAQRKVNISTLIPKSERYFACLVGEYQQAQNIIDHAQGAAKEHINQLISWRPFEGFLLSLLLSSHAFITLAINTDELEKNILIQAFEWLQKGGDRISQIGAIEIGLSILDRHPEIEPFVQGMIEQIRDDNPEEKTSRFYLLSSLIILVDGEISRAKILPDKPPYWRRLASIAQASLIERQVIKSGIDPAHFAKWAEPLRLQNFYLQTIVDLRQEPRWLPDYNSPHQLRSEFIGRILGASHQNNTKIQSPALRELLFGNGPDGINSHIEHLTPFISGPLEGGLDALREPTDEILRLIEEGLDEDIIRPQSFTVLINSALIFRLKLLHAQLAAKTLRSVKHQLRQAESKKQLFSVLFGLARVAAVTRSGELAEEIRILTRRCRYEPGRDLSADEAMRIGLIAAAAHTDQTEWCEFLGEWITELAFQMLQPYEMEGLLSHIEHLCRLVPELWCTCGRADAALRVSLGT
jgi:hypothetical protein